MVEEVFRVFRCAPGLVWRRSAALAQPLWSAHASVCTQHICVSAVGQGRKSTKEREEEKRRFVRIHTGKPTTHIRTAAVDRPAGSSSHSFLVTDLLTGLAYRHALTGGRRCARSDCLYSG